MLAHDSLEVAGDELRSTRAVLVTMRPQVIALALVLASCTHVAPKTRVFAPIKSDAPPVILVTANMQQEAVERALRGAGLSVSQDLLTATLVLRAKIGSAGRGCTFSNVFFDIRENDRRLAVIKGRGWLGAPCTRGDILREMSEAVARMLSKSH